MLSVERTAFVRLGQPGSPSTKRSKKRENMKNSSHQRPGRPLFAGIWLKHSWPLLALVLTAMPSLADPRGPDMVLQWNEIMENTVRAAGVPPPGQARPPAMVHAAIFDAVNGIDREYTPYLVTGRAPGGARAEAAAAQAAYAVLVALYPAQQADLQVKLTQSLAQIPGERGKSRSIARGVAWGQYVAEQILAWRSHDGWTTPDPAYAAFTGLPPTPGVWRSVPVAGAHPVFPQMATLVPFAMQSHDQFRPGPPPALSSQQYADDVNETKTLGDVNSAVRTANQTQLAKLWAAVGLIEESRILRQVAPAENRLVDNARLFALATIVMADATIAGFDSKYKYNFWRPFSAIREANSAGNPAVVEDPTWTSLIAAPNHQEYISNHAVITGGLMGALGRLLGDEHTFTLSAPGYPSFTTEYQSFSAAAAEVKEARIWAGIHYRNSCNTGQAVGTAIADYIVGNFLLPLEDTGDENRSDR